MDTHGAPASLAPVPAFAFPERAVTALGRAAEYAEWRRKPLGAVESFDDFDTDRMRAIIDGSLAAGGGWLDAEGVNALLRAAKIKTADMEVVSSPQEAFEAAIRIGAPVAIKAQGAALLHKTEANALRLGIADEIRAEEAYCDLSESLGESMSGAIVQQMIGGGVEVMIGATADPNFGHVLAFGAGGTLVELLADVAFRIHPLTHGDATEMLDEARVTKLLRGYRGSAPLDVDALKETLLRLSALLTECPEIREIDINPMKVLEHGAVAVDARVRIEAITQSVPSRRVAY